MPAAIFWAIAWNSFYILTMCLFFLYRHVSTLRLRSLRSLTLFSLLLTALGNVIALQPLIPCGIFLSLLAFLLPLLFFAMLIRFLSFAGIYWDNVYNYEKRAREYDELKRWLEGRVSNERIPKIQKTIHIWEAKASQYVEKNSFFNSINALSMEQQQAVDVAKENDLWPRERYALSRVAFANKSTSIKFVAPMVISFMLVQAAFVALVFVILAPENGWIQCQHRLGVAVLPVVLFSVLVVLLLLPAILYAMRGMEADTHGIRNELFLLAFMVVCGVLVCIALAVWVDIDGFDMESIENELEKDSLLFRYIAMGILVAVQLLEIVWPTLLAAVEYRSQKRTAQLDQANNNSLKKQEEAVTNNQEEEVEEEEEESGDDETDDETINEPSTPTLHGSFSMSTVIQSLNVPDKLDFVRMVNSPPHFSVFLLWSTRDLCVTKLLFYERYLAAKELYSNGTNWPPLYWNLYRDFVAVDSQTPISQVLYREDAVIDLVRNEFTQWRNVSISVSPGDPELASKNAVEAMEQLARTAIRVVFMEVYPRFLKAIRSGLVPLEPYCSEKV